MNAKRKPFDVHDAPNGWTIEEHESVASVWIGKNLQADASMGRYTARYFRIPSSRTLQIFHFQGSTPRDRVKSLRAGALIALGKIKDLPWTRHRMKNGHDWYFKVLLGDPINVAHEFQRMTADLDADMDEVRINDEFHRLIEEVLA